ncbi:hypothetical protein [Enterococcus gilvus]|uniref:Uncharacterized protein n=1 Tax=Enterococcus gilvus ATCC BAA-350 TaxID=1158614 RepID=R2VI33_9ENTE|nr:hypothetical protein [Enterococcus gilvus]EOI57306.1 hypothetical protein UKC_01520 [Enterococcus gilvus ATCC BAA-350]EOW83120.1 hypothetical protein I592_02447 [Enterococcus gilvus ATCC BAA-350]OJG39337.1 hypothetical protein RV02_GL002825 [Enterococcus gilvus]
MGQIEVTKREIILCIAITAVLIGVGFLLSGKVLESSTDKERIYNTAVKTKTKEDFDYSLETEQGHLISEGKFTAVEPVTFSELDQKFSYVCKTREVYTMHTRQVPQYDSKGNLTGYTTEFYWTWDYAGSEKKITKHLKFYNHNFKTDKFRLISTKNYGGYRYETSHIRYFYDVVPKSFRASFIAKASRDGLVPSFGKRIELSNRTLIDQIEYGKSISRKSAIYFWVLWTILIILVNVVFVVLDNRYLNS